MIPRALIRFTGAGVLGSAHFAPVPNLGRRVTQITRKCLPQTRTALPWRSTTASPFHTISNRSAQGPTADTLMENINDLYATAKDEFEIAAEETEKKTVYAQDDRDAAREALALLKEAFDKALKESDPDVSKEVRNRVGRKLQELENAVVAMEESAMED